MLVSVNDRKEDQYELDRQGNTVDKRHPGPNLLVLTKTSAKYLCRTESHGCFLCLKTFSHPLRK